jgi:hypothetical protein
MKRSPKIVKHRRVITVNKHVCKFKGCNVWPKDPRQPYCGYHRIDLLRKKIVLERKKNKSSPNDGVRYRQSIKDWITNEKIQDYSDRPIPGETVCTVRHSKTRSTLS